MTDLNLQEDSSLYSIEPEILIFKLDTDNLLESNSNTSKISKQIELKIKNEVNKYLSFRIKTVKKLNYIITPSHCIIAPKEEKTIKIRFKRDEGEKLKLKSYRIQLEGFIISEEEKDENSKILFEEYKKNGAKVIGKIIQVRSKFLDINDNSIATLSSNISLTKNNEPEIFVSALSKEININDINKNDNQNKYKDEKNPLLIDKNKPVEENKNEINKVFNNNLKEEIISHNIIDNNKIDNNIKEDKLEENNEKTVINQIEEISVINTSNNNFSNILNNLDEQRKQNYNLDNTQKNEIKNERIDLLSKASKKQIIIAIIIIFLIIAFIIYFTI